VTDKSYSLRIPEARCPEFEVCAKLWGSIAPNSSGQHDSNSDLLGRLDCDEEQNSTNQEIVRYQMILCCMDGETAPAARAVHSILNEVYELGQQ
jgi:hypothetical protein